jgi:hypothetical protein
VPDLVTANDADNVSVLLGLPRPGSTPSESQ